MATEPEQLRAEIEATRLDLAGDVDRLADRTNPKRIVQRRWGRVRGGLRQVRHRVMGASDEVGSTMHQAMDRTTETVRDAPHTAARATRGNPLAAGLIAFGSGLLVATLLPETQAERRAGQEIADHTGALADSAKEMGRDLASDVGDTVRQSADEVKDAAKQAASHTAGSVKESTRS